MAVALLAEGVDRNAGSITICGAPCFVALLAEGVDRNSGQVSYSTSLVKGRPPRGGRG